jgi:hypothetical protein
MAVVMLLLGLPLMVTATVTAVKAMLLRRRPWSGCSREGYSRRGDIGCPPRSRDVPPVRVHGLALLAP